MSWCGGAGCRGVGGGRCEAVVVAASGRAWSDVGAAAGCWVLARGSAGGGERADAAEGFGERVAPWPAEGEMKRPASGGTCEAAGDAEQSPAQGGGGADHGGGQPEGLGLAQQVVCQRSDHGPGGVGEKVPGGKVREGLVFEIADRELDLGVLTMLGLDERERVGAVGDEWEQFPRRQQLALAVQGADAANDESPAV